MKMRLQQAFFNSSQPWRRGPNIEVDGKSANKNVQVGGPQHREIGFPISTDNASWGGTTIKKYFFFRN
ncbi:hypothetical protein LH373_01510 [Staphylococcus argenteus]|nr:hypothetical protein [Staphylococcus argenteus]